MAQGRMLYKKQTIPDWLKKHITQRDKYTCQICSKIGLKGSAGFAFEFKGFVDFDCTIPKPIRFEIDHIIPEFSGGTITKDNLQLVCRKCNRKKGYFDGRR